MGTLHRIEPRLDEAQIAADAAAYSDRLLALDCRREVALYEAQRRFDAQGLPREVYRIEHAS